MGNKPSTESAAEDEPNEQELEGLKFCTIIFNLIITTRFYVLICEIEITGSKNTNLLYFLYCVNFFVVMYLLSLHVLWFFFNFCIVAYYGCGAV